MGRQEKFDTIHRACTGDANELLYRGCIIGQDGRVDIISDNAYDVPDHIQSLRPGLWRTYIRQQEEDPDDGGFWMVWLCDGRSEHLLNVMLGAQDVDKDTKEAALKHTSMDYIKALGWQGVAGNPGGDGGVAIRPRHVLSTEFYNFFHSEKMEEARLAESIRPQYEHLPQDWRQYLEEIYDTTEAGASGLGDDLAGYVVGGALIACESRGYDISIAKNDQGEIIGVLLGDIEDQDDDDSDIDE